MNNKLDFCDSFYTCTQKIKFAKTSQFNCKMDLVLLGHREISELFMLAVKCFYHYESLFLCRVLIG